MAPLTLTIKDESGETRSHDSSSEAACKIPYLQTMLSTQLGTEGVGANSCAVLLPKGCTSQAFVSLLKRVDASGDDLRTHWVATAEASVALICTADFLMLTDLIPELVRHCRYVLKSPADVKLFLVLRIMHPDVSTLAKDLRNGPLAGAITVHQAQSILRDMSSDFASVSFSAQAAALSKWLSHPDRTIEDVNGFTSAFPKHALWNLNENRRPLKNGALDFVSALSRVAKERPPFFKSLIQCIFKIYSNSCDVESVKLLVGKVFSIVIEGLPPKPEDVDVLIRHASASPYDAGVRIHLPLFFNGCDLDGKDALVACLVSLGAALLNNLVTAEFLQVLGITQRAAIVAQMLTYARQCDPSVLALIREAVSSGEL